MGLGLGLESARGLGDCSGSPQACVVANFVFSAPSCAVTAIHGCRGSIGNCTLRVIHVRRLFGNKMRLIQLQVSVSTYCYHPGSNGPGSEKPWIDSTFA